MVVQAAVPLALAGAGARIGLKQLLKSKWARKSAMATSFPLVWAAIETLDRLSDEAYYEAIKLIETTLDIDLSALTAEEAAHEFIATPETQYMLANAVNQKAPKADAVISLMPPKARAALPAPVTDTLTSQWAVHDKSKADVLKEIAKRGRDQKRSVPDPVDDEITLFHTIRGYFGTSTVDGYSRLHKTLQAFMSMKIEDVERRAYEMERSR